jgi:transketolase
MLVSNIDMRDAFFDKFNELAKSDPNLILLTADHGAFSLNWLKDNLPHQYYNVGISEQNMISHSAGLALGGKKVFAYSIANFISLRVLEQVSVDLSQMNLPVTLVGVGAGFTYSTDGPTHQGLQDVAAMSSIPNLMILNSSDPVSTRAFAKLGYSEQGPKYIRIEKGVLPALYPELHDFKPGVFSLRSGVDITIIATGIMVHRALEVADLLEQNSVKVGVIDLYRLKPINVSELLKSLEGSKRVVTLEEHTLSGGMGSIVLTALMEHQFWVPVLRLGIKDQHCYYYSNNREYVLENYNLGKKQIVETLMKWKSQNE